MVQTPESNFCRTCPGPFSSKKGSSLSRQEDPGLVPSEAPRPLGEGDMVWQQSGPVPDPNYLDDRQKRAQQASTG